MHPACCGTCAAHCGTCTTCCGILAAADVSPLQVINDSSAREGKRPAGRNTMDLTPEQVVKQLRALEAQIASVVPLTSAQRRAVSEQTRISNDVVLASINLIG